MVDRIGLDDRCHRSHSITPLLSCAGEENETKGLWVKKGQGEISQELLSRTKETQFEEITFIYCQSNQRRVMTNKNYIIKDVPSSPPFFCASLPIFSISSGPESAGGWGMWWTVQFFTGCLCFSFLLTLFFCSSTDHFNRILSFRNRRIQCGFPVGSQALPANLYQYELPMGSQPSLGIHVLQQGVFHELEVDLCSIVGLLWGLLPCHGLHHRSHSCSPHSAKPLPHKDSTLRYLENTPLTWGCLDHSFVTILSVTYLHQKHILRTDKLCCNSWLIVEH